MFIDLLVYHIKIISLQKQVHAYIYDTCVHIFETIRYINLNILHTLSSVIGNKKV